MVLPQFVSISIERGIYNAKAVYGALELSGQVHAYQLDKRRASGRCVEIQRYLLRCYTALGLIDQFRNDRVVVHVVVKLCLIYNCDAVHLGFNIALRRSPGGPGLLPAVLRGPVEGHVPLGKEVLRRIRGQFKRAA